MQIDKQHWEYFYGKERVHFEGEAEDFVAVVFAEIAA